MNSDILRQLMKMVQEAQSDEPITPHQFTGPSSCRKCGSQFTREISQTDKKGIHTFIQCLTCMCLAPRINVDGDECAICKVHYEDRKVLVCEQCHKFSCVECITRDRVTSCVNCQCMRVQKLVFKRRDFFAPVVYHTFLDFSEWLGPSLTSHEKIDFYDIFIEYYAWLVIASRASTDPCKIYAPPGIIDGIWRSHITFDTHKYQSFCQSMFGKIIHRQNITEKKTKRDAALLVRRTLPEFSKLTTQIWKCSSQSQAYNEIPTGQITVQSLVDGTRKTCPFHKDYTFEDLSAKLGQTGGYVVKGALVGLTSTLNEANVAPDDNIMLVQNAGN